jgi:aspartate aminotransferase
VAVSPGVYNPPVHTEKPTLPFGDAAALDRSLSDRVRGLTGSEILRIASEIRKMVAAGQKVCNLTVGDFDSKIFPVPSPVLDAVQRAYAAGETNYPPSDGILALRRAVADYVAREWEVRYPIESVLIASGVRPVLYAAYRCVLNPGDKVVYSVPSWNNNHYAWMSRAEAVEIATTPEQGFLPTPEQIAPHLADARLVIINSPLNPAGTVMEPETLARITRAIVEENQRRAKSGKPHVFLVYDQVYAGLVFGDARHAHPVALVPESAPYVISLDGVSKAFASTGLRVGWVLAAPAVIARMKDLLGHVGAWAPRPEQVAFAEFLADERACRTFETGMRARVYERLTAIYDELIRMRDDGLPVSCVRPQGAIYMSMRLDVVGRSLGGVPIASNEEIRRVLLERAGLGVVPFQAFGLREDTGWFRLSVGAVSMQDIEDAMPRLRRLLS